MQKRTIGSLFIAISLVVTALAAGPGQRVAAADTTPYYVALGDSLAQGVQPNSKGQSVETNQGYVDDLFAVERTRIDDLQINKLGCPGETTISMIKGGLCRYRTTSQLTEATAFLRSHRVALVTIDIGANNIDKCIKGLHVNFICYVKGVAAVSRDLPVILQALRAAAPGVPIVAMNYYDPFLAAWLVGPAGQALAKQSVLAGAAFNHGILGKIYHSFGVPVADVSAAFHTADFTNVPVINLPVNVVLICAFTWMCAPTPVGPNVHANALGYAVIAAAFADIR